MQAVRYYERRHVGIKSKVDKDENGSFLSSKGSLGGVGLESVRQVAESYSGYVICEQCGL